MVIISILTDPDDGIIYTSNDVQLKIGDKLLSRGTLYITENSLSWKPFDKDEGISINWPEIGVQAISNTPTKSVYFMLDKIFAWAGVYDPGAEHNGNQMIGDANDSDNDEGNESDCEPEMTEMWLIPTDQNTVDIIFQSMKECQALHPDPADSVSEDEGEYMAMDEDEDEANGGQPPPVGDEVGQDNMRNLSLDEDKFADAEDD